MQLHESGSAPVMYNYNTLMIIYTVLYVHVYIQDACAVLYIYVLRMRSVHVFVAIAARLLGC